MLKKIAGLVLGLCVVTAGPSLAVAQALDEASVARMGNEEKIEGARAARTWIAEVSDRIGELRRAAASAEDDPTRVRCLSEAATSINGFSQVAGQAFERLQTAVATGDTSSANHQYMMVMISRQRVTALEAQASQCAGHALRHTGDTQRTVSVERAMAEFDGTATGVDSGGAFIFVEGLPARTSAER